jgi:hypothetical protein
MLSRMHCDITSGSPWFGENPNIGIGRNWGNLLQSSYATLRKSLVALFKPIECYSWLTFQEMLVAWFSSLVVGEFCETAPKVCLQWTEAGGWSCSDEITNAIYSELHGFVTLKIAHANIGKHETGSINSASLQVVFGFNQGQFKIASS